MKQIILSIMALSFISSNALSQGVFNYTIPQPDIISDDWDGDGLKNHEDPDDDGDGINDEIDSSPFDRGGQSTTGTSGGSETRSFVIKTPTSGYIGYTTAYNGGIDNDEGVNMTVEIEGSNYDIDSIVVDAYYLYLRLHPEGTSTNADILVHDNLDYMTIGGETVYYSNASGFNGNLYWNKDTVPAAAAIIDYFNANINNSVDLDISFN